MGARAGSWAVLMSAPLHAKILVVGPQRAGKTAVSNNIAKFREIPSDYYHATVGVRVHEFEHVVPGKSAYSDNMSVSIELWDVSGDHRKYKECWPAIQKDCDGVLFVFDADQELGPKSDVEIWFREFVDPMMRSGLSERQIAACGHSKQAQDKQLHPDRPLPANVPRMKPFRTSLNYEDGKNMLGSAFNALLGGVVQELKEKQDRLESQIGALPP